MKFNSQICTTKEQSERLLALGLKKETADMHHYKWSEGYWDIQPCPVRGSEPCYIPAWSLHRLLSMLTYQVIYNGAKYEPVIALDGMAYQDVCTNDPVVGWSSNLYTDVIDCIEWLIGQEQFNPVYLGE
jgi:hypothetical protein